MDNGNVIPEQKDRQESFAIIEKIRKEIQSAPLNQLLYRHPDARIRLRRSARRANNLRIER